MTSDPWWRRTSGFYLGYPVGSLAWTSNLGFYTILYFSRTYCPRKARGKKQLLSLINDSNVGNGGKKICHEGAYFPGCYFLLEKAILTNPTLLNTTCPCSTELIWLSLSNPSTSEKAMKIRIQAKGKIERESLKRSLCLACVLLMNGFPGFHP